MLYSLIGIKSNSQETETETTEKMVANVCSLLIYSTSASLFALAAYQSSNTAADVGVDRKKNPFGFCFSKTDRADRAMDVKSGLRILLVLSVTQGEFSPHVCGRYDDIGYAH